MGIGFFQPNQTHKQVYWKKHFGTHWICHQVGGNKGTTHQYTKKIKMMAYMKYNIVTPIILYCLSTQRNLNQIPFWRTLTSSNPIDICEKLLKDWKLPLKGEEHKEDLKWKGNSKNKEDSQKCFLYGYFENETTSNIKVNWKNSVAGIGKLEYKTTRL